MKKQNCRRKNKTKKIHYTITGEVRLKQVAKLFAKGLVRSSQPNKDRLSPESDEHPVS